MIAAAQITCTMSRAGAIVLRDRLWQPMCTRLSMRGCWNAHSRRVERAFGAKNSNGGFLDSHTLLIIVTKNRNTAEHRLQIDTFPLKENYRRGELKRIGWIPGKQNSVDTLAKDVVSGRLPVWKIMKGKALNVEPIGWVIRKEKWKTAAVSMYICVLPEGMRGWFWQNSIAILIKYARKFCIWAKFW